MFTDLLSTMRHTVTSPCSIDLEHVAIDAGGYTENGRYFGTGEPVWLVSYENDDGDQGSTHARGQWPDLARTLRDVYPEAGLKVHGPEVTAKALQAAYRDLSEDGATKCAAGDLSIHQMDTLLGNHGDECVWPMYPDSDIEDRDGAPLYTYSNTGDSYALTVCYCHATRSYFLGSLDDLTARRDLGL